jgi:hypothetical protein
MTWWRGAAGPETYEGQGGRLCRSRPEPPQLRLRGRRHRDRRCLRRVGGLGETSAEPPGRAARPEAARSAVVIERACSNVMCGGSGGTSGSTTASITERPVGCERLVPRRSHLVLPLHGPAVAPASLCLTTRSLSLRLTRMMPSDTFGCDETIAIVIVASAICLVAPPSALADAPWQCEPGRCWWGYNHLTPSTNNWVPGPWNYWVNASVSKLNGGTITYGMYSASAGRWCLDNMSGNTATFFNPADVGCGGYNRPALGYFSGNSSYTRMQVLA